MGVTREIIYAGSTRTLYFSLKSGETKQPITDPAEVLFEVFGPNGSRVAALALSRGEASAVAGQPGTFRAQYRIPRDAPGKYEVVITGTSVAGEAEIAVLKINAKAPR